MFTLERSSKDGYILYKDNIKTEEEVMRIISRTIEQEGFKSFYFRAMHYDDYVVIDYGSHSNFFRYKAK